MRTTIERLYALPFFDLIQKAHAKHQEYFDASEIELCVLSNFKTGACPEDCGYCSQSGHHSGKDSSLTRLSFAQVLEQAKQAKACGAKRFCMGAAWRSPPKKDFPMVLEMIKAVKKLGLEACVTLGMLDAEQAQALKAAGLDFYNHNLDTSPGHYSKIVTTRTYADRLATLQQVADAGLNVCCGGILGLGESKADRIRFLLALTELSQPPTSIPINQLIPMSGTPLANSPKLDSFEFIRIIAVARLLFPRSKIRLAAGRESMSETMQAWCFMAGANSIFYGDKLLTAKNSKPNQDQALFDKLNLRPTKTCEA